MKKQPAKKTRSEKKKQANVTVRDCTFDLLRLDGDALGVMRRMADAIAVNGEALREIARCFSLANVRVESMVKVASDIPSHVMNCVCIAGGKTDYGIVVEKGAK